VLVVDKQLTLSDEDRKEAWQMVLETRLPRLKWSMLGLVVGSAYIWLSVRGVAPRSVATVADIPSIGLTLVCWIIFSLNFVQLLFGYCVFRKGWSSFPSSFVKAWKNAGLDEESGKEDNGKREARSKDEL
jgi:hypothetical protein